MGWHTHTHNTSEQAAQNAKERRLCPLLSLDAICIHEGARVGEVESAVPTFVIMQERVEVEIIQHVTAGQGVGEIQRAEISLEVIRVSNGMMQF